MKLNAKIEKPKAIKVSFGKPNKMTIRFANVSITSGGYTPPSYDGEYVVTPKTEEQSLPTKDRYLTENITIKAIPSDYGKITYDQNRTITVS